MVKKFEFKTAVETVNYGAGDFRTTLVNAANNLVDDPSGKNAAAWAAIFLAAKQAVENAGIGTVYTQTVIDFVEEHHADALQSGREFAATLGKPGNIERIDNVGRAGEQGSERHPG